MLCNSYFQLQDQEKTDGVTSTGKVVRDPTMNTKGEASQKPPIMLLHQIAKSQVY